MVPNLSKSGFSFKAAEQYHNHDKRPTDSKEKVTTQDRVEWVSTRNLMTDDPTTATRIMIATALDGDRLKQAAGIKNTGRKSARHVQTLSLAWHPDEVVTRAEMEEAADEVIKLLELSDCQVVIYCHNDTDHTHIHLVANRVNPYNGRMAGLPNAKRKLDKWSQEYELRRGNIVSPNRDAKYRRLEKAKKRYPDAKKRRAWVENKRKEAAEKSSVVTPKSERWDRLKAAEAKRAAQRAAKAKEADLALRVPVDHQEAAEWLLRPFVGFSERPSVQQKLTAAVLAHDPELDFQKVLKKHLPGVRRSADPREVFNRLEPSYVEWSNVHGEILDDPVLNAAYDELSMGLSEVAQRLDETSWPKIGTLIEKSFSKRLADTIRHAVDFLANLFREEKIATLEKPVGSSTTDGSKQSRSPALSVKREPGGGYSL